jgi:hypothetical protein
MGQVVIPGVPRWPGEPESDALGFVLPGGAVDLAELATALRQRLPDATVVQDRRLGVETVAVFAADWMVQVQLMDSVRSDAEGMANDGFLRDHARAVDIATCDRLVLVAIADPHECEAGFEALDTARQWLVGHPEVIAVREDTGEPM